MSDNTTKRMSITLPEDVVDELKYLSKCQGLTENRAINKAIVNDAYIKRHCMKGGQILFKNSDGSIIEIVFR